jgi:pimeloyl-ACP methyl ester carboxylesterase
MLVAHRLREIAMDVRANDTTLYAELTGQGAPVVFVHGSWGDHHNWDLVAPAIAQSHRTLTYDRRGHSQSERPVGQGSVHEDVTDLAALIEALDLAPVHLVGNSFGAIVSLNLAAERPELVRSLFVHEPPLVRLLAGVDQLKPMLDGFNQRVEGVLQHLRRGDGASGAQRFVEDIAMGSGAWDQLPPHAQRTFIDNAPTWLDEMQEPDALDFDLSRLQGWDRPTLLSRGDQSPPMFGPVMERVAKAIPAASRHTFVGAGHVPHTSHPANYIETLLAFIASSS